MQHNILTEAVFLCARWKIIVFSQIRRLGSFCHFTQVFTLLNPTDRLGMRVMRGSSELDGASPRCAGTGSRDCPETWGEGDFAAPAPAGKLLGGSEESGKRWDSLQTRAGGDWGVGGAVSCLKSTLAASTNRIAIMGFMKMRISDCILLWILGLALAGPLRAAEKNAEVDFARQILPVLSNKCFVCHGPDTRKKDLVRLDSYAGATADLGGYRAIDPKAPDKSEILHRIHSKEEPMPPEKSHKKLTDAERQLISRWVRQGGKYAIHWAFVPPVKSKPANKGAVKNAIDGFILAQLEARGVGFAPQADRATLARRAALVLTGLPPGPQQLAAFLADKRADAYERYVEKLMASPRYGEHQARYWLDAVRYGDTHGLHLDNRRGIYPYRDWVVKALNDNQPLDQFITWQLAGDLLPNPTLAQRVATGFVRMNPTTSEGGAIPAEFQAKNNFDRVETLGTVLLGSSLICARCHTHKYDPIPQLEYYRLMAFFNSTAERSMDGNSYIYGPVVKAPPDVAGWNKWNKLEADMGKLFAKVNSELKSADRLAALLKYARARGNAPASDWRISKAVAVNQTPDEKALAKAKGLPGVRRDRLPKGDKAIWVRFNVKAPADQVLWLSYSGGLGSQVLVDGEVVAKASADQRKGRVELRLTKGAHQVYVKMTGGKAAGTQIEARLTKPWQALARTGKFSACSHEDRLTLLAMPQGPLAHLKLQKQAQLLADRYATATAGFTTTLVAQDLPKPRETRLLKRGEYNMPTGDPLQPGILTVMGAFPKDAPRNRLGLARWLTDRKHPLVARVLINRVWQSLFGEGLVRTPEDFGLQGEQPTHPKLLDYLAVELHDSGWDLKHMLRLMVTSRTFKQSSVWRKDIDDAENRLFSRGPRYRLDAEVIRDIALWSSQLLDPAMGGEGVKPYQPGGLWLALAHPASNTKKYVRDQGQKLYRRSLYVYWKRTSPHPMMTLFDAPNRETSCVKRSRTNTSLQSLGLFNETQRLEMSRKLAERLLHQGKDDTARLDLLFTLLASRKPTAGERAACMKLVDAMRKRYSGGAEKDAVALLSAGDAPRDTKLSPAEHAAWTQLTVTVLASDVALLLY